jgi:leucyl/phenylalanyl-tRNA--protein transferase
MIFRLDPDIIGFPDPRLGEEDGLFAVGGDLSAERLILAYKHGIFPWYAYRKEDNGFQDEKGNPWIQWWCPMQRFVIFPDEIHVSHSMRTLLRKEKYVFSINRAFGDVIVNCGRLREKEKGAWLGPHIIEAYTEMHRLGYAASVEVWEKNDETDEQKLVGGLYGIYYNKVFFGESMFSLVPSASKMALIFLASWMRENGMKMIDCQLETPHLKSMGGRFISYDEYMDIINK